jgi:hypothetical protein
MQNPPHHSRRADLLARAIHDHWDCAGPIEITAERAGPRSRLASFGPLARDVEGRESVPMWLLLKRPSRTPGIHANPAGKAALPKDPG